MYDNEQLLTLARIAAQDVSFNLACRLAANDVMLETRDESLVGEAGVRRDGNRFTLDNTCPYEMICPCWRDGEIYDLAAWNGSTWATLGGREIILGFDALIGCSDHLCPLRIYRDPVDWYAAKCEGVVILEPLSAWRPLERFDNFLAHDLEHGELLEIILQRPARHFTIHIPAKENNHA